MQRQQRTKEWKKLETIPAWQLDKVKSKKEGIKEAQKNCNKVHFAFDGFMASQECGVGSTIPEVQGPCCASMRHCEGRLQSLPSIHRTGPICIANDGRKSNGCRCATTRLPWTSSRRNSSLNPGEKWRMLKGCSNFRSQNVLMSGFVFQNTSDDSVVPLERILYGHRLAGLLWKRQFEEALVEPGWEEVPNWACLFVHRKTKVILIGPCGRPQNVGQEAEYGFHVEEIDGKC